MGWGELGTSSLGERPWMIGQPALPLIGVGVPIRDGAGWGEGLRAAGGDEGPSGAGIARGRGCKRLASRPHPLLGWGGD